jgi:ketosteroid isomerase-like protein
MGAPSPELVDLWLARAFNAHDVEAAAAMYHPEASVVCLEQVHGSDAVARGAAGIRETMAGYIGLKQHMELTAEPLGRRVAVVTHQLVRGEAASTEPIADALLVTAKSAGAALVAGAGARSAKEASHA